MLGNKVRVRVPLPDGMFGPPIEYDAHESFSLNLFPVEESYKERITLKEYIERYESHRQLRIKLIDEGISKIEPCAHWDKLSIERQNELYDMCGFVTWLYSNIKRKAVYYPNGYYIVTDKWVWLTQNVEVIDTQHNIL